MGYLDGLNGKQLQAVQQVEGNVCVLAGPGTGKTKTLAARYCYLVGREHVGPSSILCITFTKKAANEMLSRIRSQIGEIGSRFICTFHSLANAICHDEIFRAGFPANYNVLGESESDDLISSIFSRCNLWNTGLLIKDVKDDIFRLKNSSESHYIDQYILNDNFRETYIEPEPNRECAVNLYLQYQASHFALDFEDLIHFANYLMSKYGEVRQKWCSRFSHIMVDEFQDITKSELQLVSSLSSSHNLFVVGDPDQNIYSFRGSDVQLFYSFESMADHVITLDTNYRSYQPIIDLSHSLIINNRDRKIDSVLKSNRVGGCETSLVHCDTTYGEASAVAKKIEELNDKGVSYSDIAIIYKNHSSSFAFQQSLLEMGIPFEVIHNSSFLNSTEVVNCLAALKFALNRNDDIAFRTTSRVINKFISNAIYTKLDNYSKRNGLSMYQSVLLKKDKEWDLVGKFDKLTKFVDDVDSLDKGLGFEDWAVAVLEKAGLFASILQSGDEDKANNLKHLIELIHYFEPQDPDIEPAREFLDNLALMSNEAANMETDRVSLLSIHASKGLEFKVVFLVDFNEGLLPGSKITSEDGIMEERRVAYVAMTRASDELYIYESRGDDGNALPSRFIKELKESLYKEAVIKAITSAVSKIAIGSTVKDAWGRLGKGIVQSVDLINKKCQVSFSGYTKEVGINGLILVTDGKHARYDDEMVRKIKSTKKIEYKIGDIVLAKYHSNTGIIISFKDEDKNVAVVNFGDGPSMVFDLLNDEIIKRSELIEYLENK